MLSTQYTEPGVRGLSTALVLCTQLSTQEDLDKQCTDWNRNWVCPFLQHSTHAEYTVHSTRVRVLSTALVLSIYSTQLRTHEDLDKHSDRKQMGWASCSAVSTQQSTHTKYTVHS